MISDTKHTVRLGSRHLSSGLALGLALAVALTGSRAFAQTAPAAPPLTTNQAGTSATGAPRVETQVPRHPYKFSIGRFFLESLVASVVGSAGAYGTYKLICGQEVCLGALAGLGVNVVVTPLTVWGLGKAAGGGGSLGAAYLGGAIGLGAGSAMTTVDPVVALGVGTLLMPFTSALAYEASSNRRAHEEMARARSPALAAAFAPVYSAKGITGASLNLAGKF